MSVRITGIGVVSAIGLTVEENLFSLKAGRSGIAPVKYLDEKRDLLVGEVKVSNQELIERFEIKNKNISRTSLLGLAAARQALGTTELDSAIRTERKFLCRLSFRRSA